MGGRLATAGSLRPKTDFSVAHVHVCGAALLGSGCGRGEARAGAHANLRRAPLRPAQPATPPVIPALLREGCGLSLTRQLPSQEHFKTPQCWSSGCPFLPGCPRSARCRAATATCSRKPCFLEAVQTQSLARRSEGSFPVALYPEKHFPLGQQAMGDPALCKPPLRAELRISSSAFSRRSAAQRECFTSAN